MTSGRDGRENAPGGPCGGLDPVRGSTETFGTPTEAPGAVSGLPVRVLVTGSRDWPQPRTVWAALDAVAAEHAGQTLTVVHGACKTGADAHAAVWCGRARDAGWDVLEEPHPADWTQHGNAAGPIRNRAMVEAGADVALVFLGPGPSKGTRGTLALAIGAGIPVRRYETSAEVAR